MTIQKFAGSMCYHFVTNTSAFVSFSLRQQRLLTEILLPTQSSNLMQEISNVTESSIECKENQSIAYNN